MMKRRSKRTIEVFSMSAIDLFASAMSAFVLMAIVLIPYYQKEIKVDLPLTAIADQLRAANEAKEDTVVKKKALAEEISASRAKLSKIQSEIEIALAEFEAAELEQKIKLAEAERVIEVPEPISTQPAPEDGPSIIAKHFLGIRTDKSRLQIVIDLSRGLGPHHEDVSEAVDRILNSLQPRHQISILAYQQTDGGPRYYEWPGNGTFRSATAGEKQAARLFFSGLSGRYNDGAATLSALTRALDGEAEAVFLISRGLANPRYNGGSNRALINRVRNQSRPLGKEVHTVLLGDYQCYAGTVELMEQLANESNGIFMALAPGGSCS
ncbi:MAG: hypothetical protein AAFX02_06265 [Pseudomonadota bacterium]